MDESALKFKLNEYKMLRQKMAELQNHLEQVEDSIKSLYYEVVVIKAPLQGLCYTIRDAVDWLSSPTTRWFTKGSNHSPLHFC